MVGLDPHKNDTIFCSILLDIGVVDGESYTKNTISCSISPNIAVVGSGPYTFDTSSRFI